MEGKEVGKDEVDESASWWEDDEHRGLFDKAGQEEIWPCL